MTRATMKSSQPFISTIPLNEDDVRDYAYHLYVQNGHRNDECRDNWLEAKACLEARIPKSESHVRLHKYIQKRNPPPVG
jgi:hypothetical protein